MKRPLPPPNALQAARVERGYSQARLAAELGVSRTWLALVERQPSLASPALLDRILDALAVPRESIAGFASPIALVRRGCESYPPNAPRPAPPTRHRGRP